MDVPNSHVTDINSKRQRKANFSDEEVRVLLEGIGQQNDIILSKLMGSLTAKKKKQAWERVVREVNACGKAVRTEDDVKKKWKDLKSAVLREDADRKKTGGGGPIKPTPYKELIMHIIGDRSDAVSRIEVAGTDSIVVTSDDSELALLDSAITDAVSRTSQLPLQEEAGKTQDRDHMASTSTASTSAEASGSSTQRVTETSSTATAKHVSSFVNFSKTAGNVRRAKRKHWMSNGIEDDSQLFNAWLSSEITKNKAETELIDLKKTKMLLEITKLKSELAASSVPFATEQYGNCQVQVRLQFD